MAVDHIFPGDTVVLIIRCAINGGCGKSPLRREVARETFTLGNVFELFHLRARLDISRSCMLRKLQSADVRCNRPAIFGCDLRSIIRHRAVAVRHHAEEVAKWCGAQAVRMEVARRTISALHDDATAVADARVTRRAVDVVTLLSSLKKLRVDREGHAVAFLAANHAGQHIAVGIRLRASNGVLHLWAHTAAVGVERAPALGVKLGLVLHVLTATGQESSGRDGRSCGDPLERVQGHSSTSTTLTAWNCSRNARVSFASNCGSIASRQRKNLLSVAPRRKLGALKSGW